MCNKQLTSRDWCSGSFAVRKGTTGPHVDVRIDLVTFSYTLCTLLKRNLKVFYSLYYSNSIGVAQYG